MEPSDAGVEVDACAVDGGTCPAALETTCRVGALLPAASTCTGDDDCTVFRFPPNCLEYGRCPGVAVNFAREAQFSLDATRLLNTFCANTTCRPVTSCSERRTPIAVCTAGRCAVRFPQDAGSGDGGVRDGGP